MELKLKPDGIFIVTDLITLEPPPVFVILNVNVCEPAPEQIGDGLIEGAYLSLFPSVNTHSAFNPELSPMAVNFKVAPSSSASDGTVHVEFTLPSSPARTVQG